MQAGDKDGWLALMTDDILIEDPIGESVTNPDGTGVRGKDAVGAFFDANIGPNQLTVTREATFPSSSPNEIAYILVLRTEFPNGFVASSSRRVHLQSQRRRPDHELARLLEHGRDGVLRAGQEGLARPLDGRGAVVVGGIPRHRSCGGRTAGRPGCPRSGQRTRRRCGGRSGPRHYRGCRVSWLTRRPSSRPCADRHLHTRVRQDRRPGELCGHRGAGQRIDPQDHQRTVPRPARRPSRHRVRDVPRRRAAHGRAGWRIHHQHKLFRVPRRLRRDRVPGGQGRRQRA